MERISCFIIFACFLASCNDDFYSEGRVKTIGVTEVTTQSAILKGKVQIVTQGKEADIDVFTRGFVYGRSSNNLNLTVTDQISEEGSFSCHIYGLFPNTKYYAKAFATIHFDIAKNVSYSGDYDIGYESLRCYGNIIEFMTQDGVLAPSVTTELASSMTPNSIRLNGIVEYEGYPAYTERGFIYDTIPNLTIERPSKKTVSVSGNGLGSYFADITDLKTNDVTYYVCAYVKNSEEPVYGEELSFHFDTLNTPDVVLLPINKLMVQKKDIEITPVLWTVAKAACASSPIGGYTDWRLPTKDELMVLYTQRNTIGNFTTDWYWSSTAYSGYQYDYWGQSFSSGAQGGLNDYSTYRCRCVRTYKP